MNVAWLLQRSSSGPKFKWEQGQTKPSLPNSPKTFRPQMWRLLCKKKKKMAVSRGSISSVLPADFPTKHFCQFIYCSVLHHFQRSLFCFKLKSATGTKHFFIKCKILFFQPSTTSSHCGLFFWSIVIRCLRDITSCRAFLWQHSKHHAISGIYSDCYQAPVAVPLKCFFDINFQSLCSR